MVAYIYIHKHFQSTFIRNKNKSKTYWWDSTLRWSFHSLQWCICLSKATGFVFATNQALKYSLTKNKTVKELLLYHHNTIIPSMCYQTVIMPAWRVAGEAVHYVPFSQHRSLQVVLMGLLISWQPSQPDAALLNIVLTALSELLTWHVSNRKLPLHPATIFITWNHIVNLQPNATWGRKRV